MTVMTSRRLDIVIPGAQKSGTTSLLDALGNHPGIMRAPRSEFGVLSVGGDLDEELRRAFANVDDSRMLLAKSAGMLHAPGALARLREHNPGARLVCMLREPVSRMYSSFLYARRRGYEPLETFEDALAAEPARLTASVESPETRHTLYRWRSDYVTPLRLAVELFGHAQLKIVLLEDYQSDRARVLADVQGWLGLPVLDPIGTPAVSNAAATARSQTVARLTRSDASLTRLARRYVPDAARHRARDWLDRVNERSIRPERIDPNLRRRLRQEFEPQVESLRKEFGLDLSRWT